MPRKSDVQVFGMDEFDLEDLVDFSGNGSRSVYIGQLDKDSEVFFISGESFTEKEMEKAYDEAFGEDNVEE